jgi:hypothetical protein
VGEIDPASSIEAGDIIKNAEFHSAFFCLALSAFSRIAARINYTFALSALSRNTVTAFFKSALSPGTSVA